MNISIQFFKYYNQIFYDRFFFTSMKTTVFNCHSYYAIILYLLVYLQPFASVICTARFFSFEHLEANTTQLGSMQQLDGLFGRLLPRVLGVPAVPVAQHVHIDQVAHAAEGIFQRVDRRRLRCAHDETPAYVHSITCCCISSSHDRFAVFQT